MSPPATPVKSHPSRNDIFSEDHFSSIPPTSLNLAIPGTNTPTSLSSSIGDKESLKGLGLVSAPSGVSPSLLASSPQGSDLTMDFDAWNSEARKRRSGAYTFRSRSNTPTSLPSVRASADTAEATTSSPETPSLHIDYSKFLGRGLTSSVYAATLNNGTLVAAKVPNTKQSAKLLQREASVLKYLHSFRDPSEYVIPFYGSFRLDDDSICLAFELCSFTIKSYIEHIFFTSSCPTPSSRPLSKYSLPAMVSAVQYPLVGLEVWRRWILDLISGLDFLHTAGVLHNDIKPHNILLTDSLHPYLSDFAVSTFSAPKASEHAHKSHGTLDSLASASQPLSPGEYSQSSPLSLGPPPDIIGTTVYTAPELLSAEDVPTTTQSDIYALGITMFVAAMGQEPFSWTNSATQKIMLKKREDIFVGLGLESVKRLPDIVQKVIEGMCECDSMKRWSTGQIRNKLMNR